MENKLRKGVIITVSYQEKILYKFDDTFVFTDIFHGNQMYDGKGKKQYFPKNSERYHISISKEYFEK